MFRKTGREDQGWWRGRLDEAPTRHLQVGGKDPWSANVNQLIGDFKDVVVICYYEERELQPDPEYCREVVRCSEDFEAFIRELDVSPRVLTPQDVDGVEAGIDLEFTCRYNIHSGQTRLHFPPDSTYGADWLRLHVTHHRDRGWEFLVENKRDLKGSSLNEQEAATLARPPRLIVPAEGALAYSMDDVRRIVEGLPSTERFADLLPVFRTVRWIGFRPTHTSRQRLDGSPRHRGRGHLGSPAQGGRRDGSGRWPQAWL